MELRRHGGCVIRGRVGGDKIVCTREHWGANASDVAAGLRYVRHHVTASASMYNHPNMRPG